MCRFLSADDRSVQQRMIVGNNNLSDLFETAIAVLGCHELHNTSMAIKMRDEIEQEANSEMKRGASTKENGVLYKFTYDTEITSVCDS